MSVADQYLELPGEKRLGADVDKQKELLEDEEDEASILRDCREAYARATSFWEVTHRDYRRCIKFSRGKEQWDAKNADGNRPKLAYSFIDGFIDQALNRLKESPPEANVIPGDGNTSRSDAKLVGGWLRQIQKQSNATDAYLHAHERMLRGGIGAVMLDRIS